MSARTTQAVASPHSALDIAPSRYDSAAILQREVATRMAERLAYLRHAPTLILDVGAGTGFGTRLLRAHYADAQIIALDLSHCFLQQGFLQQGFAAPSLFKRLFSKGKIPIAQPVVGEFSCLPLKSASVDMLWSNLALHRYDPDVAIKEAQRVLKPGGLIMFSMFGVDTLKELRTAAGSDAASMPRFIDMHDVGDVLSHNGFAIPVMDMETITLTYADIADLFNDMRHTGETNLLPQTLQQKDNMMAQKIWADHYEKFRREGKLPATFEIVYGHAWKAEAKKQSVDGKQIIEFRDYPKARS